MSAERRRRKARERADFWATRFQPPCPNCGEPGSHWGPPGLGSLGMWTCSAEARISRTWNGDAVRTHLDPARSTERVNYRTLGA